MLQRKEHGAPSRQLLCSGVATAGKGPRENLFPPPFPQNGRAG